MLVTHEKKKVETVDTGFETLLLNKEVNNQRNQDELAVHTNNSCYCHRQCDCYVCDRK